ncbi:MAG: hypothetical protein AABZ39_09875 [Spirochaetota bacterium]
MQAVEKIKMLITGLDEEVTRLEVKRIKAATTKVRKALQEISRACKEGRLEANAIKAQITAEKQQTKA